MRNDYLLKTDTARALYGAVKDLPIIDYHNHLAVKDLMGSKNAESITEMWLVPDPYKHRLMRICGIPEHFITGDASPYEKFEKFASVLPSLAGNPVYDWARMELSFLLDREVLLTKDNAKDIYDELNERLCGKDYTYSAILRRFGVEYQAPVATPTEDLSPFQESGVAPSLRADALLDPTAELKMALEEQTGIRVTDTATYLAAVGKRLDTFREAGCAFVDHSLDANFFAGENTEKSSLLVALGTEYAKRDFTLLLHMGAARKTSTRLATVAGPAGGYAAAGASVDPEKICRLLDGMETSGGLPDTVLFPLNMSDQAPLAVLQGSFSEDGVSSKVQLGPAWWWCDHPMGIRNTLEAIASFGAVSRFIGMTTDSRSVLSFVRHDYFRRILCTWLTEKNKENDLSLSMALMTEIAERICYKNAKEKLVKGR